MSIYVFSYFPFGFEGRIWDLIVSVPDHCLSFYFENLDAMAKEADLFAEVRGGVFSCVNKGQRDNNKGAAQRKPESKPSGKPEIKCGICGKGHSTIRC